VRGKVVQHHDVTALQPRRQAPAHPLERRL
jgi:hypothetical protein